MIIQAKFIWQIAYLGTLSKINNTQIRDVSTGATVATMVAPKFSDTVKLGNKERFDKEQIGIKELFMDYQPFYTINLLLDKELLPI